MFSEKMDCNVGKKKCNLSLTALPPMKIYVYVQY